MQLLISWVSRTRFNLALQQLPARFTPTRAHT